VCLFADVSKWSIFLSTSHFTSLLQAWSQIIRWHRGLHDCWLEGYSAAVKKCYTNPGAVTPQSRRGSPPPGSRWRVHGRPPRSANNPYLNFNGPPGSPAGLLDSGERILTRSYAENTVYGQETSLGVQGTIEVRTRGPPTPLHTSNILPSLLTGGIKKGSYRSTRQTLFLLNCLRPRRLGKLNRPEAPSEECHSALPKADSRSFLQRRAGRDTGQCRLRGSYRH